MITALTESLVQPLDTEEPSPGPKQKPETESLIIQSMETEEPSPESKYKPESLIQPMEVEEPGPEPKCKSEPEPLLEVKQEDIEQEVDQQLGSSPSALRQVFDGVSDDESFQGFLD